MSKRVKYPLIFLYVVGISIIMLLSITTLNVFNENSIRLFNKYVLTSYQKDVKTEFTKILFMRNENLAKNYSFVFDEAAKTVNKIAGIATNNLNELAIENNNRLRKDSPYNAKFLSRLNSDINLLYELNQYSSHIWVNLIGDSLIVNPSFKSKKEEENSLILQSHIIDKIDSSISKDGKFPMWLFYGDMFKNKDEIISVITPFFKKNKELAGYAGVDLNFSNLAADFEAKNNTSSYDSNKYSLILSDDFYVVHVSDSLKTLFGEDVYRKLLNKKNPYRLSDSTSKEVESFIKNIGQHGDGIFYLTINHIECVVAYSRMRCNNWIVLSIYPVETLFNSVQQSNLYMEHLITKMSVLSVIISIILLFITIFLTAMFFKYLVLRPIRALDDAIYRISKGDFNVDVKIKGILEISKLANGVKLLCREIETYMHNLQEETRNRLAYETELEITSEIQKSILPKLTPDFKRKEYSLYAKLIPASGNVSGDFFDFFYVNENTLIFSVGDVAGKGIAAAFFMNKAKNLIKNECYKYRDKGPAFVLNRANKKLAAENNVEMFLTMYLCFYDIRSGILTYANAGHHEIMMIHKNGDVSSFGLLGNSMLGLYEENTYYDGSVQIGVGDTLVLYTDGILDATDKDDNTFGDTLFLSILKKYCRQELEDYASSLIDEVSKFERGNRFDDITILLFRRKA